MCILYVAGFLKRQFFVCRLTFKQGFYDSLNQLQNHTIQEKGKGKNESGEEKNKVGINRHRILKLPTLNDKNDVRRTHLKAQPSSIVF